MWDLFTGHACSGVTVVYIFAMCLDTVYLFTVQQGNTAQLLLNVSARRKHHHKGGGGVSRLATCLIQVTKC